MKKVGTAAVKAANGKKRAVIATARTLAVLLHRLWVSGEAYEPLRKWNGGDTGISAGANLVQRKNKRTHLTPTGLLMEGLSTH